MIPLHSSVRCAFDFLALDALFILAHTNTRSLILHIAPTHSNRRQFKLYACGSKFTNRLQHDRRTHSIGLWRAPFIAFVIFCAQKLSANGKKVKYKIQTHTSKRMDLTVTFRIIPLSMVRRMLFICTRAQHRIFIILRHRLCFFVLLVFCRARKWLECNNDVIYYFSS